MKVLAFDPSGNKSNEGQGTSGYSIGDEITVNLYDIRASDYETREAYWFHHREVIEQTLPDVIVIESYRLFGHKSKQQTGSSLETPMLIGYLQMVAYEFKIPVILQDPSTKTRHSDDVLLKTGILEKKGQHYYYKGILTNMHKRDSLRHHLYFMKYGRKKLDANN